MVIVLLDKVPEGDKLGRNSRIIPENFLSTRFGMNNQSRAALRFDNRVALITGAGRGLGRAHALLLASRGCTVVINDLGGAYDGGGDAQQKVADEVVAEIRALGGTAHANYDSVESGADIVDDVIRQYGRLDIVINNAGILTPEVWSELTLESWQKTLAVNLTGVFSVMKAAWPHFVEAGYGRSIMTASPAMHGAGVAAYAASKAGVIGLSNSLQFEAKKLKLDIKCNAIVPHADTRMTRDFSTAVNVRREKMGKKAAPVTPQEILNRLSPAYVSPLVAWLAHEDCTEEATVHEAGAGYFARFNWARSDHLYATEKEGIEGVPSPEDVRGGAAVFSDFAAGDLPPAGDGAMAGSALARVFDHLKD
ncbi:MAG: SDR family NAD(P)-dependent oxidoreductase [Pseudomonadales bacterium]